MRQNIQFDLIIANLSVQGNYAVRDLANWERKEEGVKSVPWQFPFKYIYIVVLL